MYVQLTAVGATEPQERNCVILSTERDEYGMRFAHARFEYSNGDRARIEIMRIRIHQAAETLGRKWLSIELNADYVAGSRLRFTDAVPIPSRSDSAAG